MLCSYQTLEVVLSKFLPLVVSWLTLVLAIRQDSRVKLSPNLFRESRIRDKDSDSEWSFNEVLPAERNNLSLLRPKIEDKLKVRKIDDLDLDLAMTGYGTRGWVQVYETVAHTVKGQGFEYHCGQVILLLVSL